MEKTRKNGHYDRRVVENGIISFDEIDYAIVPTYEGKIDVDESILSNLIDNGVSILIGNESSFTFKIIDADKSGTYEVIQEINLRVVVDEDIVIDYRDGNYIVSSVGIQRVD